MHTEIQSIGETIHKHCQSTPTKMKLLLEYIMVMLFSLQRPILSYTLRNRDTSYLHYTQLDMRKSSTIRFRFKTSYRYGLLMYSDNSQSKDDKTLNSKNFISLKLKNGGIQVTIQIGEEDYKSRRTETVGEGLNDLKWHVVKIKRDKSNPRTTIIHVDKFMGTIINDGDDDQLTLNSGVYFGGIANDILKDLVDGTISIQPRLIGCIDQVEYLIGESKNIQKIPDPFKRSKDVLKGCQDKCSTHYCFNGGRCINKFIKATCDCIGTGFIGRLCDEETDPLTFSGNDYVAYELPDGLKETSTNHIAFRFKTTQPDGVMIAAKNGNDHFMIELYSTIIRMSMNLGGGAHIYKVSKSFNDGAWHIVRVIRKGIYVSLIVDNRYMTNHTASASYTKFSFNDEKLYIGGHPDVSSLESINVKSNANFNGCLQHVFFNTEDIIYKVLNTRSSRFKLVGSVNSNCEVQEIRPKHTRENEENNVSEVQPPKSVEPEDPINNSYSKSEGKTLSRNSVTWIIVGLVVGCIVFIVTVACIVHNIRHRYSGVFLSSQAKGQYQQKLTPDGGGTLLYTPRNAKIMIQPHLV